MTGDWVFIYSRLPGEGNDGDFNFGWQGIGGTVFIVDPTNDFFLIYSVQTIPWIRKICGTGWIDFVPRESKRWRFPTT